MNKLSLKLGSVALLALSFYVEEGKADTEYYCPPVEYKGKTFITQVLHKKRGVYAYAAETEGTGKPPVQLVSDPMSKAIQFDSYHAMHSSSIGGKNMMHCSYSTSTGTDITLSGTVPASCKPDTCKPLNTVSDCMKCGASEEQPPR